MIALSGFTAVSASPHGQSAISPTQDGISQQADQQLSIGYADGTFVSTTQSRGSTTEFLVIEITTGSITLGPQTDTEVRVQDVSTGETLILTPTDSSTEATVSANSYQDNDLFMIRRSGATFGQFNVVPSGNVSESVTVEMAESGATQLLNTTRFGPFEVSIVGENGAVQAQTQPVPHGIRQPKLNGEFNSTAISIERPTGFNSSWRVDLYPTVDAVRNETPAVSLHNEEDAEFFRGVVRLNSSDDVEINVLPPDTNPEASAVTIVNYESPLTLNLTRVEGPVGASTGSTLDGAAGEYDDDGDGTVTASELGSAVTDFGQGELTASELGEVVTAFGQS
jgi:hypothetical protein